MSVLRRLTDAFVWHRVQRRRHCRCHDLQVILVLVLSVVAITTTSCQPKTKTLVVGTSADWKPFEYIAEDGSYAGFDIELMEEIGERLRMDVQWREVAFDNLIDSLIEGEIDAIIAAMNPTPERQALVDFTEPYYVSVDAVLVRAGSGITLSDEQALAGYQIGVVSGTVQETWVTETISGAALGYDHADQAVAALKAGEIDLAVISYYTAQTFAGDEHVALALYGRFSKDAVAIAVRKGNSALRTQLNETIAELQEEGFIEELAMEFMSGE